MIQVLFSLIDCSFLAMSLLSTFKGIVESASFSLLSDRFDPPPQQKPINNTTISVSVSGRTRSADEMKYMKGNRRHV